MRIIPLLLFGAMLAASAEAERRATLDDVLNLNRKVSGEAVRAIRVDLSFVEGDTLLSARYVASRDERMQRLGLPISLRTEKRRRTDGAVLQSVTLNDVELNPGIDQDERLP